MLRAQTQFLYAEAANMGARELRGAAPAAGRGTRGPHGLRIPRPADSARSESIQNSDLFERGQGRVEAP